MTQYVQAWKCEGDKFSGYVYNQAIAIDKMALGCNVTAETIVRHDNGDREYLPGCIAAAVQQHREKVTDDGD